MPARSFRPAVLVLLVLAMQLDVRAQPATANAEDDAVREVVARYVSARERRDADAIGALFTADADQVNSAGEWRRGRPGIVAGTLESSRRNSGTRRIAVKHVRFPLPTVAIVDGDYEIATPGQGAPRQMWTTFVMIRQADAWRISAIRNSRPTGNAGSP